MIGEESSLGVVDSSPSGVTTADSVFLMVSVSCSGVSVDGVGGWGLGIQLGMLLSPIQRIILFTKVVSPILYGSLATKLEDIVSIVVAKTQ